MIEREREREQIRRKIKRLEKKTNRTSAEETELANLRKKLRELENNIENKPVNYLPWIIGGSVLVVGIIIIWLVISNQKKKRTSY